jgi:probable phosphoglycerate mutase
MRIYSSPMRRARETAQATAELCGVPVTIDERLAEFDLGALEYIPTELAGAAVHERVSAAMQTGRWGTHRFDPIAFRERVAAAFAEIAPQSAWRRTVVFCHGGVINSYLSGVLERPHGMFFEPRYTCVSRLRVDVNGAAHLLSLNELPHAHLVEAQGGEPS